MQKDILDFLSEFAVFLQDHKFAVSESALAHLLRLVESAGVDITEEDEMLAALSVCLAKTGEQVAKMKALFREFLSKKTIPQREKQKEKEKQESIHIMVLLELLIMYRIIFLMGIICLCLKMELIFLQGLPL